MPEYSSLSDFYNDSAPQTPAAIDRLQVNYLTSTPQHTRNRPPLLPLKTTLRKPSATGTTNSSSSDLRLTPQTPSLRFADPLAQYIEYQGGHPSIYLREHGSNKHNERRLNQHFSEFNVGSKNSVQQIDYCVPDHTRPLEVRIQNRSLFVDPKLAREASPQFHNYLLQENALGHKRSVEPKLDFQLRHEDVLCAIQATFPTDYGLFAKPVTTSTFSAMSKMSFVFDVQKLKQSCELFVSRLPLTLNELNAALCANLLNDSFKYCLSERTKIRLLQGVICLVQAEIQDPSRLPTYSSKNQNILPVVGNLIDAALEEHKTGSGFNHGELLNEARLKIPCRNCRIQEPVQQIQPSMNELQVCKNCRTTICRTCSISSPCYTLVEQFMKKFAKEYAQSKHI